MQRHPWLSMAAASSRQASNSHSSHFFIKTQQTKLPNVKVEAQEGMSGQPDGGAGADPLLPALHLLHHHRHPRPPLHPSLLPQSSCSRQRKNQFRAKTYFHHSKFEYMTLCLNQYTEQVFLKLIITCHIFITAFLATFTDGWRGK